jgi:hypothetical protein
VVAHTSPLEIRELQRHQRLAPESDEAVEELTDVDRPSKERQKVLPVDCTALRKAKQQLYHVINKLIHSACCLLLCLDLDELVRSDGTQRV